MLVNVDAHERFTLSLNSAMDVSQIDRCRVAGGNENLAVLLMAPKFNLPVCPHAGEVGLCECVQHLPVFDYLCVSAWLENRVHRIGRSSASTFC
jgi:L-alanine-DL-glutamate epimerase-like enolase superfamily enzyme